jgi:hypothetical protein
MSAEDFTPPEPKDPPPAPNPAKKRRGRPPGSKNRPKTSPAAAAAMTDKALRDALAMILVFPSVPVAVAPLPPDAKGYMVAHFSQTAPWGADQLVTASKSNPALRALLERMARGSTAGVLATFLAVYVGGPVAFIMGQRILAESLTLSASDDSEAALAAMLGSMVSTDATIAPEPPPDSTSAPEPGAAAADAL